MNRNLSKKNMKIKLLTVLLFGLISTFTIAEPKETGPRILESRKVIKEFAGKLKKELVQAMEEGGPVNAIKVCNIEAPGIAAGLSDKYQWRIGRTSLKTRNSNNNPDDWELDVLQQFEQLLKESGDEAQGSDRVARARMAEATIKKLEYAEETEDGFEVEDAVCSEETFDLVLDKEFKIVEKEKVEDTDGSSVDDNDMTDEEAAKVIAALEAELEQRFGES